MMNFVLKHLLILLTKCLYNWSSIYRNVLVDTFFTAAKGCEVFERVVLFLNWYCFLHNCETSS